MVMQKIGCSSQGQAKKIGVFLELVFHERFKIGIENTQ